MAMAQDWNIKPRAGICSGCERTFVNREVCNSVLRQGEEGFVRFDYCDACWKKSALRQDVFSTWSGEFRAPDAEPEEAVKKETAESLLRKLIEEEEDNGNENVIYILAVMLERQRILVERDVRTLENGSLLRVYERRKSGETFLVHDPRLELNELAHVQEEVIAMLGPREGETGSAAKDASGKQAAAKGETVAGPVAVEACAGEAT